LIKEVPHAYMGYFYIQKDTPGGAGVPRCKIKKKRIRVSEESHMALLL